MNFLLLLALISAFGLWAYGRIAPHWGLVDRPNARSLHEQPTVVGGGIVPVTLIVFYLATAALPELSGSVPLLIGGLMLLGLADDKWGVPSGIRLACYLAAGLALMLIVMPPEKALSPTSLIITVAGAVVVTWCTNLFNFMDGADGLAIVQFLCVAVGLGLVSLFGAFDAHDLVMLCALLFACCFPFLWFNWPPAKMFMGDAGAIPLGFSLALLGLCAFKSASILACVWLILMMPFLIDTGLTLCIRTLRGQAPHVAHRDHAYQRLAIKMGGALPVTLGLLGLQVVWQFPLAVTAVSGEVFPPLLVVLSAIPSLFVVVYARARA